MRAHGGFEGNAQTLRILTDLIYPRQDRPRGMHSTRAFLDGVLKYKRLHREAVKTTPEGPVYPKNHFIYDDQERVRDFVFDGLRPQGAFQPIKSIECQIMDWADDTAYSLHDIVDGVRARFITAESLEEWGAAQDDLSAAQRTHLAELCKSIRSGYYEPQASRQVGDYIRACRLEPSDDVLSNRTARHRFKLVVEGDAAERCVLFKRIAVDLIFKSAPLQQIEFKGGHLLDALFGAYETHYLGTETGDCLRILPPERHRWMQRETEPRVRYRLICDHLSAMTDSEALRMHRRLFDADFASIAELV